MFTIFITCQLVCPCVCSRHWLFITCKSGVPDSRCWLLWPVEWSPQLYRQHLVCFKTFKVWSVIPSCIHTFLTSKLEQPAVNLAYFQQEREKMYNWHVITFSPWTRFSLSWPHTLSSNDPLDLVLLLLPRPVCCVHAHAAVLPHYSREIWARAAGESCSAGLYPGLCLPKCAECCSPPHGSLHTDRCSLRQRSGPRFTVRLASAQASVRLYCL